MLLLNGEFHQAICLQMFFLPLKKEDGHQQVPRIFVTFKEAHTYQLRAYIYQARDMYGSDRSGLSGN